MIEFMNALKEELGSVGFGMVIGYTLKHIPIIISAIWSKWK